jgi:hypothetical protein
VVFQFIAAVIVINTFHGEEKGNNTGIGETTFEIPRRLWLSASLLDEQSDFRWNFFFH